MVRPAKLTAVGGRCAPKMSSPIILALGMQRQEDRGQPGLPVSLSNSKKKGKFLYIKENE
jgi:hypothetical protein